MKKLYHVLFVSVAVAVVCLLASCASTASMSNTPNYNAAEEVHAEDVSSYADHVVENCTLPDGKTVTVYVFDNVYDHLKWQYVQTRRFDPEWQQLAQMRIADLESWDEWRRKDNFLAFWKWMPTGPLSPAWKAYYTLETKYGKDATLV